MPQITNTSDSSSQRPLPLCVRADLHVQRNRFLGREQVVVKDPIAMKYFRFEEEEFAILEMLDGTSSLEQLQREFESRFQPQRISFRELERFLGRAYRDSLIVSDAPGQGQQLRIRHDEQAHQSRRQTLANVLCIRFKGIDPDRFLVWMNRWFGWLFSPLAFAVFLLSAISAVVLVAVQFGALQARLPEFHEFFAAKNWLWLAMVLAGTKILHELGHGLACKRFGGECHEMGVMLLVLTPCLYCNVSDSWTVSSKWHRAAIAAAGMYVEIGLASICTFLWWFSEPGSLHYLCLNVMVVCSVSTIVFNANPLLRYDGYYILSDLAEIPNLRQKASGVLKRGLARWWLKLPQQPDRFLPKRKAIPLAAYAVASAVYRWLVMMSIFWFLLRVFEPYGLNIVGQMLICAALYGLAIRPLWQIGRAVRIPGMSERIRKSRLVVGVGVGVAIAAAVLLVPLPHSVWCDLQIRPHEASSVYVQGSGTVEEIYVRPGATVRKGQPLVKLENLDAELEVERLVSERDELTAKLQSLRQRSLRGDTGAALEIEPAQLALAAVKDRLERRREGMAELRIIAPTDGTVFPPPPIEREDKIAGRLPSWSGRPLQPENIGALLSEGVLICRIGDQQDLEAVLAIDQDQMEFLRPGQRVEAVLNQFPGRSFHTEIKEVSEHDAQSAPGSLTGRHRRDNARQNDAAGGTRSLQPTYRASCTIDDEDGRILIGARGRARVFAGYQTLAQRLHRYVARTFNVRT